MPEGTREIAALMAIIGMAERATGLSLESMRKEIPRIEDEDDDGDIEPSCSCLNEERKQND